MPTIMRRIIIVTALAIASCHHHEPQTVPPGAGPSSGTRVAVGNLDGELVGLVATSNSVDRMKIRTDEGGTIVKQSIYHHDASAIPEPVRELASKRFPDGKLVTYESELYAERGRVYEVEVEAAKGRCEIAAKADGALVYEECRIDPAALPAPVAARVTELWPGGRILEAETKKGPDVDEVTVEVETDGKEFYLRAKPDGTVVQKLRRVPAVLEVPLP